MFTCEWWIEENEKSTRVKEEQNDSKTVEGTKTLVTSQNHIVLTGFN